MLQYSLYISLVGMYASVLFVHKLSGCSKERIVSLHSYGIYVFFTLFDLYDTHKLYNQN